MARMFGCWDTRPTGTIVANDADNSGVSNKRLVAPNTTPEDCVYTGLLHIWAHQRYFERKLWDRMDQMKSKYLPNENRFKPTTAFLRKLFAAYLEVHFAEYYANEEFRALMTDRVRPLLTVRPLPANVRLEYLKLMRSGDARAMDVEMDVASELFGVTIKAYTADFENQTGPTIMYTLRRTFQPKRSPPISNNNEPQDLGTWKILTGEPFENGCQYVDASTGFLETADALNRATGPSPTMESLGSGVAAANAVLSAQAPKVQVAVIRAMSQKALMTKNAFVEYMQPYVGKRAFVAGLLAFLFASYLVLYMTTHPEVVPLELPVVRAEPLPGDPSKIDFQRLILSASPNASVVDEVFRRTGRGKQAAQRNTYGSAK